jgi:hypothetical protein
MFFLILLYIMEAKGFARNDFNFIAYKGSFERGEQAANLTHFGIGEL